MFFSFRSNGAGTKKGRQHWSKSKTNSWEEDFNSGMIQPLLVLFPYYFYAALSVVKFGYKKLLVLCTELTSEQIILI